MTFYDILVRVAAVIVFTVAAVGAAGGQLIKRDTLPDGMIRTQTLTLYKNLPLAPVGPRFCPVVNYEEYAMAFPCNFRPPFVDWLEGKRY
jgi:hypothetical protein